MKKGFTLIELLAVIVILAVIALIATPTITGIITKARENAVYTSALNYIDAIEKQKAINLMDSDETNDINDGLHIFPYANFEVNVKGQSPSNGWFKMGKNGVIKYSFVIGEYVVSFNGTKKTVEKGSQAAPAPIYPRVVYSRVNGATHIGYPIDEGVNLGSKYNCAGHVYNSLEECSIYNYQSNCTSGTYTTPNLNYQAEPNSNWNFYLKHTLSAEGIIEKSEACAKVNDQTYCIDGTNYSADVESLKNIYGVSSCQSYTRSDSNNQPLNKMNCDYRLEPYHNIEIGDNGSFKYKSSNGQCSINGQSVGCVAIYPTE